MLLLALLTVLRVLLGLLQLVQQWLRKRLHDVRKLVEDRILCVVHARILKDQEDVALEHVALRVLAVLQLLTDALNPHGFLDDRIVVRRLLLGNGLAERPRVLVVVESLQDVITLLFERLLLGLLDGLVVCLRPASLNETWDVAELVVDAATPADVQAFEYAARDQFTNLVEDELRLCFDRLMDILVVNILVYLALHHRRA